MPDKSFEEQVREELSGLRIQPNTAVWEAVAGSLQKKRKRRWAVWMITLFTGLSGAGFWFFLPEQNDQKITTTLQQPATFNKNKELPIKQKNIDQQKRIVSISPTLKSVQTNTDPIEKKHQAAEVIRMSAKAADEVNNIIRKKEDIKVDITQNTSNISSVNQQTTEPITSVPLKKDSVALIPKETKEDESSENLEKPIREPLKAVDSSSTVNDTSGINTVIKKQPAKKWNWRAELVIGRSGIRNSLGSLFEGSSDAMYNNFLGSGFPTTASPGSIPIINLVRPKVQDHFSFGASVEMSKTIGKKKKNSLGIQIGYQLYQTKYRVGSTNTGTLQFSNVSRANESNIYYGVRDSANYLASYHFIRLGLQWYRSLNWLNKAELRWYAGIGTYIMLSGNGLHVGIANSNIYYFKNRSLLRTIQLDAITGLEIGIGKQKRLFVGPQVQYMLNNLSKQNGINQHLYRPSIKMSWLLFKDRK